jgi:hypothetical protein
MTTFEQFQTAVQGQRTERREFENFMNDRGEIRKMPFRIVRTKVLRNERLERRVIEGNRERNLYYLMLAGAVLVIFSFI